MLKSLLTKRYNTEGHTWSLFLSTTPIWSKDSHQLLQSCCRWGRRRRRKFLACMCRVCGDKATPLGRKDSLVNTWSSQQCCSHICHREEADCPIIKQAIWGAGHQPQKTKFHSLKSPWVCCTERQTDDTQGLTYDNRPLHWFFGWNDFCSF